MFGVFISLDLMLYYGFWELSLVPMAILIAMYGRKDGPKAALKFFLFTFIPSAPLLVAILWLYSRTHTFNFTDLQYQTASGVLPAGALFWVALAFLFAFAVKVPVFPLHGWLADTYNEAPVALAMVVAGKLGLYSMLRFHVGLFPAQARAMAPLLIVLAVIGVLYGACLALVQRDFWRLMAFAALSHLSLIVLAIYGLTLTGWSGAVYQILSHGVVDGALFLLLGALEIRYATSTIASYGGLAAKLPRAATYLRHRHAGHDRPAHVERLHRRVCHSLEHLRLRQPRLRQSPPLSPSFSARLTCSRSCSASSTALKAHSPPPSPPPICASANSPSSRRWSCSCSSWESRRRSGSTQSKPACIPASANAACSERQSARWDKSFSSRPADRSLRSQSSIYPEAQR